MEYPIHTEILASREGTGCVVHSHAESVVAFAATGMSLRAIGHEGTLFTPPDVARYTDTGDLIRTPELGVDVARAMGDRNALLIPQHGFVRAGPDHAHRGHDGGPARQGLPDAAHRGRGRDWLPLVPR